MILVDVLGPLVAANLKANEEHGTSLVVTLCECGHQTWISPEYVKLWSEQPHAVRVLCANCAKLDKLLFRILEPWFKNPDWQPKAILN